MRNLLTGSDAITGMDLNVFLRDYRTPTEKCPVSLCHSANDGKERYNEVRNCW